MTNERKSLPRFFHPRQISRNLRVGSTAAVVAAVDSIMFALSTSRTLLRPHTNLIRLISTSNRVTAIPVSSSNTPLSLLGTHTTIHSPAAIAAAHEPNLSPNWSREQLAQLEDYSKGPSALDKASRLFFFTEILRGEYSITAITRSYATGLLWREDTGGNPLHFYLPLGLLFFLVMI